MNLLATIRKHTTAWANIALSTFVIAWLSMIIAPCMMAMDMGSDSLPMEAQSSQRVMDDYSASDQLEKTSFPDCPHCPPSDTELPCENSDPDCSYVDNSDYDNLVTQTEYTNKLQNNSLDSFDFPPVILSSALVTCLKPTLKPTRSIKQHAKPLSSGVPLNVLYCVYLI